MRMKKIMIFAVAVLTLAACSKTFDHSKAATEGNAIGFGTWAETLTKARATASDNTAFANGEKFDVYGFKTTASGNSVVFNGDDVTATVSESTVTWDYTPHRFWDPSASSYTFFAVLPAGKLADEGANPYATTGKFTSTPITFSNPTSLADDILVANKEVVNGASSSSSAPYSYTNPVQIKFNHVATGVELYVKQDNNLGDGAVVKVTALSLLNISNKGTFTVSDYEGTDSVVPTVSWTEDTTPTYLGTSNEYKVLDAATDSDDVTASGKTTYTNHAASATVTGAKVFDGYVFMPQTLHPTDGEDTAPVQQIKLSYTIQVGTEAPNVYTDIVFNIRNFQATDTDNNSGTDITAWAPKTKYVYTMTIGAKAIEFSATVKNWESTVSEGYHYLVN